jgi:hypothetical protein
MTTVHNDNPINITGRMKCMSPMPQAASTVISLSRYQRDSVSRMPR